MPNAPVISGLAERLEASGWQVEIQDLPGKPGKQNMIATLGSGSSGLILSGHTDTVPCNEELWNSDPFSLSERDNRFYGLGTADMKSFLALAMAACSGIEAKHLQQPVILLATADEESSMAGARALAGAGQPTARYAVIGEPTDLKPIRMHKGIFMEAIRVQGQSGHSSDPSLGANALEGMQVIIEELITWRTQLQQDFRSDAFKVPYCTLNLGHIHGGDNPNRICGDCELQIDFRFIPSLNHSDLRQELHTRLQNVLAKRKPELQISFESLADGIDPLETPATSNLVQTAERMTGAVAGAVGYATEAPFLSSMGIETLVMGPGSINQAHQPDEYLELAQLEPTVDYLQQLIKTYCM
jgi:acetylornithine deacetylase